jgi:hypothetical protein
VRGSTTARVADREHLIGESDIDVKVVQRPMAVVTGRRRDNHVAMRDVRIELLETRNQSSDAALERGRVVQMAEGDLQRQAAGGANGVG